MRLVVLTSGLESPDKYMDEKHAFKVLKAALPHQTEYIDKYGHAGFYYLLDELQEKLLVELQKMLEGHDATEASINQSVEIMDRLKEAQREKAEAEGKKASEVIASR
jgi:hypothetical protein